MKVLRSAVLYTALCLGANAALADPAAIAALREGDMKKLAVHAEPKAAVAAMLETLDGNPASLDDYRGRWVLVNFWATWCAPCRKEMPALGALAAEMAGDDFAVVTVAVGRNPTPAIEKFWAEAGMGDLPRLRDPRTAYARSMGVLGLPVTVVLDPEGREVARLIGDADWAGDSARIVLSALIGRDGAAPD